MNLTTFVIPVAKHHEALAERAFESVRAQTINSGIVTAVDDEGIGAGAMRNLLVQTVQTPFIVFLDADDEVTPDFVERMAAAYRQGKYVYCDWFDEDGMNESPDESRGGVFAQGQFHTITTLLPTALFRLAGGFDETLAGLEDVDLFLKLQSLGVCGVRCAAPLMRYNRKDGRRASGIRANGQREKILALLTQRYEGKMRMCCGDNGNPQPAAPIGEQQPGDILVENLYSPSKMQGPVSGRLYPRPSGLRRRMYVDPRDVAARPNWWQVPPEIQAEVISPSVDEVAALAAAALSQAVDDTPVGTTAVDDVETLPSDDAADAESSLFEEVDEEVGDGFGNIVTEKGLRPKIKPKK